MAKKISTIDQIQKKLLKHIEEMEALFPMEMNITVVGRDVGGMGCEFVIGPDSPEELMQVVKRTAERLVEAEAPKKPLPKTKKKVKKSKT